MDTEVLPGKRGSRVLSMALVALFAALTAVLSQLTIPTPWQVPFGLGNLGGFLAVALLGWKEATASQAVWVLLGAVGVPVFTGFGSLSRLVGPTGGYIVGYVISALIAGLILKKTGYRFGWMVLAMALGFSVCYAFGTVWYMILMKAPLGAALMSCVVPYLPIDGVKILLAALLGCRLRPRLKR